MVESGSEEGQLSSRDSTASPGATPRSGGPDITDDLASQSGRTESSPRTPEAPRRVPSPLHKITSDLPPPPTAALSPVWQQKRLPALPGKEHHPPGGAAEQLAGRASQKELMTRSLPDLKLHLRALAEQVERGGAAQPTLAGLPQYRAILEAEGRPAGSPTGRNAARLKPELEAEAGDKEGRGAGDTGRGWEGGTGAATPRSPARALKEKAQSVKLWHEEQSASRSGQVRAVQYQSSPRTPRAKPGSLGPPEPPPDEPLRTFSAISQPQRVEPPPEWRIPERKRSVDGGKGGAAQLADFSVLANTSHRLHTPGRTQDEARALLSMAVLLENAQETERAIEVYERFLRASEQLGEPALQALAHNCLGIAHQQQATTAAGRPATSPKAVPLDDDTAGAPPLPAAALAEYEAALAHHEQHAQLAQGDRDRFLAYSNRGLLLAKMGRGEEAVEMHKRALTHAIQTGDVAAERVCVGNLGRLLLQGGTLMATAEDCIRRYLDICKSIGDCNGVAEAHFLLGVVATSYSKYATAAGEFEAALEAAKACGNKEIARFSRIHIGVAKGKVNLAQQLVALDQ